MMPARYNPDIDPALLTIPQRGRDEVVFCRAMQQWAAREVDPRNNQRSICITDWFREEFLILNERTHAPQGRHYPEFKHKGAKLDD